MHSLIEHVVNVAGEVGAWGYLIIFLIVLLECQALLGLFIPGESLVLITGFLAGQGVFDREVLIVAVALGAIVGDSIGYELGRHYGRGWLERHGAKVGIGPEKIARIEGFIAVHGGKSVFLSHFMHVLRALMPFIAGAHRMSYWRYLPLNALGCVLWAAIFSSAGYYLGASWHLVEKWVGRVGLLVAILLALAFALIWVWGWLVRHEAELRAEVRAFSERPRVAAFRRRFAGEIRFLEERLTPGGYLGLHLTIGAAIFVFGAWWFRDVVHDLVASEPLTTLDRNVAAWFAVHSGPAATRLAASFTVLGSYGVIVGGLAVTVYFALRRSWHRMATVVLTVGGGMLLTRGVKMLFHWAHPELEHPFNALAVYTFPSGYTVSATLFYGLVAVFLMRTNRPWRWRLLAPFAATFIVLIVALTRLYLGTHYISDVLAAIALGIMWLSFSVTAVETHRRYNAQFENAPVTPPPGADLRPSSG